MKIDLSKYAGTYSIENAKKLLEVMKREIEFAEQQEKSISTINKKENAKRAK